MSVNQYVMPVAEAPLDTKLGWLKESVREGETFIRNQTAQSDFQKAKDIIAGIFQDKINQQLSRMNVNLQKRLIREMVAQMSNLRSFANFTTDNRDLDENASSLNKLVISWYKSTFADRGLKKGLQYAGAYGTGYVGPDWKSNFYTRGRGEIILKAYPADNVLPVQVPMDGNIQRAYVVTIREEVPINLARAMFPAKSHMITPDRTAPIGLRKGIARMSSFLSPVLNRFAADQKSRKAIDTVFPTVDIYQSYIMDMTVNEGPVPRVMGEPGTYWNYTVPVMGSEIVDPNNGKSRLAGPEDAMLYPWRRLITWCNSAILRDDTSYWWHGEVPATPFYFDKWPWEFLGYSMTRDLSSIEEATNAIRRAMDDSANARLRPALMYDDRTISSSLMETLDTREPGKAVGVDFTTTEMPVRPVLPANYYDVPAWIPQEIQTREQLMKYLSGVLDTSAITEASQIPSSDTVEKMWAMAGAMVEDICRENEASICALMRQVKGMMFEFYQAPRRFQMLGPDGITKQDMEYFEPGSMVPDHMPWENKSIPSNYSPVLRARHFMDSFFLLPQPNSMHNISQMSRKLLYIQFQKAGLPLDPWTMADVCDIPNYGRPPQGTNTVMERWVAFQRMQGELQASIQADAQLVMAQAQLQAQMATQAITGAMMGGAAGAQVDAQNQGGGGSQENPPQVGEKPQEGRPPSFEKAPTLEQKDDGTRSTISTS
jgi:hypothetical protein